MKEQLEGKKMTAPKLEVIRFQNEDVIAASVTGGGQGASGFEQGPSIFPGTP